MFAPTRYKRWVIDVDRRIGRQLQAVMNAKTEKEEAFSQWWRAHRRAETIRNLIAVSEAELVSFEAVEQITREDCYAPIVKLARVWTDSRSRVNNRG